MQFCNRCIYHEYIPRIEFNEQGICNYCLQYDQMLDAYPNDEKGDQILNDLVATIKRDGKGKKYDVVIGVSGGCDSSYMVHQAVTKYNLRVLAVHFDNTFNSRIAVENIEAVLDKLDVDLYTHVVNNEEIADIIKSFMKASVPEIDTPTDLALAATLYQAAQKHNIKHIWEGHSFRTEGISPPGWFYMDAKYVKSIQRRFGKLPLKTLPQLTMSKWLKWMIFNKIKKHRPLYYMNFDKNQVKEMLTQEYGWQWYGGHHMENMTSYFTNNYYLPKKFKVDLRWCEKSALVRSGQMTREEAFTILKTPKKLDPNVFTEILDRLQLSEDQLKSLMDEPPLHFTAYPTYKATFEKMAPFFFILYKKGYVTRSFYDKFCKTPNKILINFPIPPDVFI